MTDPLNLRCRDCPSYIPMTDDKGDCRDALHHSFTYYKDPRFHRPWVLMSWPACPHGRYLLGAPDYQKEKYT